jgi:hypothetical protein
VYSYQKKIKHSKTHKKKKKRRSLFLGVKAMIKNLYKIRSGASRYPADGEK